MRNILPNKTSKIKKKLNWLQFLLVEKPMLSNSKWGPMIPKFYPEILSKEASFYFCERQL